MQAIRGARRSETVHIDRGAVPGSDSHISFCLGPVNSSCAEDHRALPARQVSIEATSIGFTGSDLVMSRELHLLYQPERSFAKGSSRVRRVYDLLWSN